MKNSDIAAVILIASLSVIIAYFVAEALIGNPTGGDVEKINTLQPISAEVETPDKSIFNSDAINPTVEVVIGDNQTRTP